MKIIFSANFVIITLTAILFTSPANAEEPYVIEWIQQLGTGHSDWAYGVSVDAAHNSFICGTTRGSIDAVNSGRRDVFLAKYSETGNLLWAEQLGSASDEDSYAITVDHYGNSFITGYTEGDLGDTNAGYSDIFLAKYNPSGNLLWIRQLGTANTEESRSVAVDVFGNAYISGFTKGDLGGSNMGWSDAFITKYDSSGSLLWTKQMGTDGGDIIYSMEVNESGNIIACGVTTGDLGGPNAGDADTFVAKYDQYGNEVWTQQLGTSEREYAYSVASDDFENIYITGYTYGDLGGANAGMKDAFIAKYNSDGNLVWTEQLGTSYEDEAYSVAVNSMGDVYISGYTNGVIDETNLGREDLFLAKYDSAGNLLWIDQIGTNSVDISYAMTVDNQDNIYLSGSSGGEFPGFSGINAGYEDAFLIKFAIPEPTTFALLTLGILLTTTRRTRLA